MLESYNLAKIWNLPVVFVVEDNGYAEIDRLAPGRSAAARSARGNGFGMPSREVDGQRLLRGLRGRAARRSSGRASGGGPSLLHVKLTRYYGHFEGDAMTYRRPDEVAQVRGATTIR